MLSHYSAEYFDFLASVKVGDKVCTSNYYSGQVAGITVYNVARITKTLIVCCAVGREYEVKFNRLSGYKNGTSPYNQVSIDPYTEEMERYERHDHLVSKVQSLSNNVYNPNKLKVVPDEYLEELAVVLGKIAKAVKEAGE
jgi:hypothetical protein